MPNLYSMVTGLHPEEHGIVANEMYDPETKHPFVLSKLIGVDDPEWWEGEPLWVAAERRGILSATMFWGGATTDLASRRPRYARRHDKTVSAAQRVAQILEWLDLPQAERP